MTEPPRRLWIWIVLLGLLSVGGTIAALLFSSRLLLAPRPGRDQLRGGELVYRILYPPEFKGDPAAVARKVEQVLDRRLKACGIGKSHLQLMGNDRIRVGFDGIDRADLDRYKALLVLGSLEFREVAPEHVARAWKPGAPEPESWVAAVNEKPGSGSGPYSDGPQVLVAIEAIFGGADVESADARADEGRTAWRVEFVLRAEGAKRLDEAARRLYQEQPKGRIAIVRDGRILSMPVMQSPTLGGRGQVSGSFTEAEAKNLAVVFQTGALPLPIGAIVDGKPVPGVPEEERYVDLTPPR